MRNKKLNTNWYFEEQLDFDRKLIEYRYKSIKPYFKGEKALELGPAEGIMTAMLVNDFKSLFSIDGSLELLNAIPEYENLIKIHSLFEDYSTEEEFDTIIMEHILEHVYNPVQIIEKYKKYLKKNGVIILGVPNAKSIHRMVGVKMGLLESEYELNYRDYALGHQRMYDIDLLKEDILKAGLKIIKTGGVFFKPVSNGQIEKNWTKEMMDGFYKLGKDFSKNTAEIYAVCGI